MVDSDGTLCLHREFDTYGNTLGETHYDASGLAVTAGQTGYVTVAFGFTGKLFEVYTGLQNSWHRWYDPAVGRWVSEDWIPDDPSNTYRYVGNAPTIYVDPSGLAVGQVGLAWDGTLGFVHAGFDISIAIGFSTNSYPFVTFGVGATGGGGPALGLGMSGGVQYGGTTARNLGQMEGTGATAGINTPWGSGGLVAGDDYVGGYYSTPGSPILDIHANDTTTEWWLNSGPSDGAGDPPDWHWPWEDDASWHIGDTWDLWFGGNRGNERKR